jgi:hypothetical protein
MLVLFGFSVAKSNAGGVPTMVRTRSFLGETAEVVTVELTRHELNRMKALAKGLGWSPKKRQVSVNTLFSYGLDAAEELLEDRKQARPAS